MRPGAPSADAPVMVDGEPAWFLPQLGGQFCTLLFCDASGPSASMLEAVRAIDNIETVLVLPAGTTTTSALRSIVDSEGLLAKRFDAKAGTTYLMRPDQHIAARWRSFDSQQVRHALLRATCNLGAA